MTDLLSETCPHCGQQMPDVQDTPFERFWAKVPHKKNKENARKAWAKLTTAEKALARERVTAFYADFKATYPTASPLHVSTYLNGKRWQDVEPTKTGDPEKAALDMAEKAIKNGQRFMAQSIRLGVARQLVHMGRVTEQQCRDIGVII